MIDVLRRASAAFFFLVASSVLGLACGLGSDISDYSKGTGGGSGTGVSAGGSGSGATGGASAGQSASAGTGGKSAGAGGGAGSGAGGSGAGASGAAGKSGGGASAGSSAGGAAGGGGTSVGTVGAACTCPMGMSCYACAGPAQQVVLSCESGIWKTAYACSGTKLCDSSLSPSEGDRCNEPDPVCAGHAPGDSFCDGENRITCSSDLTQHSMSVCASPKLCALGTGANCAACVPGTFSCDGMTLSKCNASGTGSDVVMTCATASQCNAGAGQCTDKACVPGQHRCMGDVLQVCNANQDGFDTVTTCGAGLCNAMAGGCDACVAGSQNCADDTDFEQCASDGSMWTVFPCPMGTTCSGAGVCIQCTTQAQCPPTGSACATAVCSAGTCQTSPSMAGTHVPDQAPGDCHANQCDGTGKVVAVVDTTDVPPSDGNECHSSSCDSSGNPQHPNRPDGTMCSGGVCFQGTCCIPKTCSSANQQCGMLDPGCGQAPIACGNNGACPNMADTCTNGACNCTPTQTCASLGADCGTVNTGCGTETCGNYGGGCAAGYTCNNNHCTCVPATTCPNGQNCGTAPNGCGGQIDCGSCTLPQTCGGGGNPLLCGCTPTIASKTDCANNGYECGSVPNGCGGSFFCGGCPGGTCDSNTCEPNCCFTAEAKITMADGTTRPISDVRAGDWVMTIDPQTGAFAAGRVTALKVHSEAEDKHGTLVLNGTIRTTPEHPFVSGGRARPAGQLAVGDDLLVLERTETGEMKVHHETVKSIEKLPGPVQTYTLEVEGFHDFFVEGVAVFMKRPC